MTIEIIEDVQRFVEVVQLKSIESYRLRAERTLDTPSSQNPDVEPVYSLRIDSRDDGHGFRVLFETSIEFSGGCVECGLSAEYDLDGARLQDDDGKTMGEFVNGVALMHLIPYTRQLIADLTQRVFGNALLMPILQRGELQFEVARS